MSANAPSESHRAGFVGLFGPPNAGKSSLLNAMLGESLAIVSPRPQTTRSRILGILARPDAQLLFLDTPGRHTSNRRLNKVLNDVVEETLGDCDVALLLFDRTVAVDPAHEELAAALAEKASEVLVVGTKSDDRRAKPLAELEAPWLRDWPRFEVSAREGTGLEALLEAIESRLPHSPPLYDSDTLTDRPVRWLCGEWVREALFGLLDQELPYAMAVDVVAFDESNPKCPRITAHLLVERESQKRIVIGRGGAMIKRIGIRARESIERWLGSQVHLELRVKVDPGWVKNPRRIEQLGYR